ncbi:MAG: hypothetical protein SOT81_06170 [Treponema sp.]|nr:hypothetical protein [Treponema sp.]
MREKLAFASFFFERWKIRNWKKVQIKLGNEWRFATSRNKLGRLISDWKQLQIELSNEWRFATSRNGLWQPISARKKLHF